MNGFVVSQRDRGGAAERGAGGGVLAWLIVACVATSLLARMLPLGGIDFQQFWTMAGRGRVIDGDVRCYTPQGREALAAAARRRAEEGLMGPRELAATRTNFDIGREADRHAVLPTATPFFYAVFWLFGTVCGWSFEWGVVIYRVLALAAGLAAIRLALGHHRLGSLQWAVVLTAFGLAPEAVASDLRVANVSLVHVFWLAAACATLTASHALAPSAGGLLLGMALAFKPSICGAVPALVLLAVAERRWQVLGQLLAGCGAGLAIAWGVGTAWGGSPAIWSDWAANVREMAEPGRMFASRVRDGNLAGMQLCAELIGMRPRIMAAVVLGLAWLAAAGRRFTRPARDDRAFRGQVAPLACAGVASGLFLSDLAWLHYAVFLLPVLAEPILRLTRRGGRQPAGAGPAGPMAASVAAGLVAFVGVSGVPLAGLLQAGPLAAAGMSNLAWLLATAAVVWLFARADDEGRMKVVPLWRRRGRGVSDPAGSRRDRPA